jgi:hypothetical protein
VELEKMHRNGVSEMFRRRRAEKAAADLQRRKMALATSVMATSASGAIVMITMAALACGY